MRRPLSAAVLLLCLAGAAAALEVSATSPRDLKGVPRANVDLSGIIVRGVTWDRGAVVLPVTESRGKTFIDVKLLSKSLYLKLETCFKSGCARPGKAAAPVLKVEALKPLKSKVRVANAEVSFDGELLVVLGVMASSREPGSYWIAFPEAVEFGAGLRDAAEQAVKTAWEKRGGRN